MNAKSTMQDPRRLDNIKPKLIKQSTTRGQSPRISAPSQRRYNVEGNGQGRENLIRKIEKEWKKGKKIQGSRKDMLSYATGVNLLGVQSLM